MMMFTDPSRGKKIAKDPAVVRFNGHYLMYYSIGGDGMTGWDIGIAHSVDLENWVKTGELNREGRHEANGICAPGALVIDNKVHLFYQTYGNFEKDAICHAVSDDGIHFKRNASNPIVRPEGEWTNGRAIDADVCFFGDFLYLYYATRDPEHKIQMAGVHRAPRHSDFGRDTWVQCSSGPILYPQLPWEQECIEAPAAIVKDNKVFMFYAGAYNNSPQQIGLAVSEDGVNFRRVSDEPFLPNGENGSWNESESGHPFIFEDDDGRIYLFYQGNNDKGMSWYLSNIELTFEDGVFSKPETGGSDR